MGHHLLFVKERVSPLTLEAFLEQFLAGVRTGQAFDLGVGDHTCSFPAEVLARAANDIEYQGDPDKTELEITVLRPGGPTRRRRQR